MPFKRFESILENRSLFFAKVRAYDDDPFEGSYNKVSKDHFIKWKISDMPGETIETVSDDVRQTVLSASI